MKVFWFLLSAVYTAIAVMRFLDGDNYLATTDLLFAIFFAWRYVRRRRYEESRT